MFMASLATQGRALNRAVTQKQPGLKAQFCAGTHASPVAMPVPSSSADT